MSRRSSKFLGDFFGADGKHPKAQKALEHFEQTFVEPLTLAEMTEVLKPIPGHRRVVIIDGHPRSGKTWSVIKAITNLIDDLELGPEQWWTSSLDSLKLFPDSHANLYDGALRIQQELETKQSLKVVLLDDFFGTNLLRPIGSALWDQRLRPFVQWSDKNPWLRKLSKGSTLIITGRSLHFTLVDILLNVEIRGHAPSSDVRVINHRRGVFRTFEQGEPFGAFDSTRLVDVCRRNREHHPLKGETDPYWLILTTPLLAFAQDSGLDQRAKEYAAHALFGEDLRSLAEMIARIEELSNSPNLPENWRKRTLNKLYISYLVTVAPGLLFLGPSAYSQLRIDEEIGRKILNDLYLYESRREFRSGRLPNEFYMIALNDHLTKYLDLAARAFTQVVHSSEAQSKVEGVGLGIRGLLERGLHKKGAGALDKLLSVSEFCDMTDSFLKEEPDCLLHLEMNRSALNKNCTVDMLPGLAAAMGWALCNFFHELEQSGIEQTVKEWFPARFRTLLKECDDTAANDLISNGSTNQLQDIVSTYSTFLQWVLKVDQEPIESGLLDSMVNLPNKCSEPVRGLLKVVLEDEIVWALGENRALLSLQSAKSVIDFLGERKASSHAWSPSERQLIANRMFTLSWHNAWMSTEIKGLSKKARKWIHRYGHLALEWIDEDPSLIDNNLQYHWCHFITQRAVWMRDWCFQDDPNAFERSPSQIEQGSGSANDNEELVRIAEAAIQNRNLVPKRVRNALLLIGTRASRLDNWRRITDKIEKILVTDTDSQSIAREDVLQAIFELGRHGFLEDWSKGFSKEFANWCLATTKNLAADIGITWGHYHSELEAYTHLDLLPGGGSTGWKDVIPTTWHKEIENEIT